MGVVLTGLDNALAKLDRVKVAGKHGNVHLMKAAPSYVSIIKGNFAAGGKPATWKEKYDGSASHLHKTGRLIGSIHARVIGDELHIGTSTPYAAIHQFGGKTAAHKIFPRKKKALAFRGIVVRYVNHPGSNIPARPFLVIPDSERPIPLRIVAQSMKEEIGE